MARTEPLPRIAVLGAGPIGLEAALYAVKLGLPVTVFEGGRVGEHVCQWGHVKMFSPFGMNSTPLGRDCVKREQPDHDLPADNAVLTGREYVAAYLNPLAESAALIETLRLQTRVIAVGRQAILKEEEPGSPARAKHPFRLLVRSEKGEEKFEEADVVLDCTGTYGRPRWLGDGGIPAAGEVAAASRSRAGFRIFWGRSGPCTSTRRPW